MAKNFEWELELGFGPWDNGEPLKVSSQVLWERILKVSSSSTWGPCIPSFWVCGETWG